MGTQWRTDSFYDGLNRLTSVASPGGAIATADYDALNNLTLVSQSSQTRTFCYDSLKRLRRAVNPESGTIAYAYDASCGRAAPATPRAFVTS